MSLCNLPHEITLMILGDLGLEDQFRLSLTCRHLHFVIRSDDICRTTLRQSAQFSEDFIKAEKSRQHAAAWRRLVKRRMAVQTASPFHFSVLGTAVRYVLANGALVYKPIGNQIRILFLDSSQHEEIQLDPRILLEKTFPDLSVGSPWTIDPLHFANNIASFLVEADGLCRLIFCRIRGDERTWTFTLPSSNCVFARNNENYLFYGFRRKLPETRWEWIVKGCSLDGAVTLNETVPSDFSGSDLGKNVCFEIVDGFLYGVSSAEEPGHMGSAHPPVVPTAASNAPVSSNEGDSFYQVFRLQLGGDLPNDRQDLPMRFSRRQLWREGSMDLRFNGLQLVKDATTGSLIVCETRKEWTPSGHSERNCYRKEINRNGFFADQDVDVALLEGLAPDAPAIEKYSEDLGNLNVHKGESGLDLGHTEQGRHYVQSYHTSSRTFVDMISDTPAFLPDRERLRLRVRPMTSLVDDDFSKGGLRGDAIAGAPQSRFWPPEPTPGQPNPTLELIHALMNPKRGRLARVDWAADDKVFVFSPVMTGESRPSALILLSFDPGLQLHGLRKEDGSLGRPVPKSLLERCLEVDRDNCTLASHVRPWHLAIESPAGKSYGFDMTC